MDNLVVDTTDALGDNKLALKMVPKDVDDAAVATEELATIDSIMKGQV